MHYLLYTYCSNIYIYNLPGTDTSPGIRLYDFFLPCTGTVHHWESDCMISSSPVQCTGTVHHRGSDCTISTSHVLILHRGSDCTIFSSPVLTLHRVSDFFGWVRAGGKVTYLNIALAATLAGEFRSSGLRKTMVLGLWFLDHGCHTILDYGVQIT